MGSLRLDDIVRIPGKLHFIVTGGSGRTSQLASIYSGESFPEDLQDPQNRFMLIPVPQRRTESFSVQLIPYRHSSTQGKHQLSIRELELFRPADPALNESAIAYTKLQRKALKIYKIALGIGTVDLLGMGGAICRGARLDLTLGIGAIPAVTAGLCVFAGNHCLLESHKHLSDFQNQLKTLAQQSPYSNEADIDLLFARPI